MNTDTRSVHNVFFKENTDQKIAIGELGRGGDPIDFPEYMETAPDGAITAKILDLKDFNEQTSHRAQKRPHRG